MEMRFSLFRAELLKMIKDNEPISITLLAKKAKISTGTTIYRYLRELEDRGLIEVYKETKKRGQPVMLKTTSKAKPLTDFDMSVFNLFKSKPS